MHHRIDLYQIDFLTLLISVVDLVLTFFILWDGHKTRDEAGLLRGKLEVIVAKFDHLLTKLRTKGVNTDGNEPGKQ